MGWNTPDSDIRAAEQLLLPEGCHFEEDALQVIRHWESVDVSACPGSGKTTVLLAKLKLLADKAPFKNGAGICVLSHTNVAVDEIKEKLTGYADKLLGYPNFIGTIHSFIDRFITIPYIRQAKGQTIRLMDDRSYAQQMLQKMKCGTYSKLYYLVELNYRNSGTQFVDLVDYVSALYLRDDGALCIKNQKRVLAGADKLSSKQFYKLLDNLFQEEGIMRYVESYKYANIAIEEFSVRYTDLFSQRFQYVYIDEYQDCNEMQRSILGKLFDPVKCVVTHIGDPDQAIYNSSNDTTEDWCPENPLPIKSSCRYGQTIADVLSPLRKGKCSIISSVKTDIKPTLIIYDRDTISDVLGKFVVILEERGLHDPDGVYKAIGHIRNANSAGINISSYWRNFDGGKQTQGEYKYWEIIDEICSLLMQGKLYKVEFLVRKLLCRLFHYAGIKNAKNGKEHTPSSIRITLKEKYIHIYADSIMSLAELTNYTRESTDKVVHTIVYKLINPKLPRRPNVFEKVPDYFMEDSMIRLQLNHDENIFIEPLRKRRIQFDTIHGVKGETHDATLYLETEYKNGSDISRILHCYGAGNAGTSKLYDYSRKIAYVGMSRPRSLLCLAIQESTYEKGQDAFSKWDIVDLRKAKSDGIDCMI